MALLLAQGFQTKVQAVGRYKRKGLNREWHGLLQEQEEYQLSTDLQNDFHRDEHDQQGKISDCYVCSMRLAFYARKAAIIDNFNNNECV